MFDMRKHPNMFVQGKTTNHIEKNKRAISVVYSSVVCLSQSIPQLCLFVLQYLIFHSSKAFDKYNTCKLLSFWNMEIPTHRNTLDV